MLAPLCSELGSQWTNCSRHCRANYSKPNAWVPDPTGKSFLTHSLQVGKCQGPCGATASGLQSTLDTVSGHMADRAPPQQVSRKVMMSWGHFQPVGCHPHKIGLICPLLHMGIPERVLLLVGSSCDDRKGKRDILSLTVFQSHVPEVHFLGLYIG